MLEFVRKPQTVKAVQFLGQEVEGFRLRKPQLIWSQDEKFYYVDMCEKMAAAWISVEPLSEEEIKTINSKRHKEHLPSLAEDKPVYDELPFAYYAIASGKNEDVDKENPLVKRYLSNYGTDLSDPFLLREDYKKVRVSDWIVYKEDNQIEIYTAEKFMNEFEAK